MIEVRRARDWHVMAAPTFLMFPLDHPVHSARFTLDGLILLLRQPMRLLLRQGIHVLQGLLDRAIDRLCHIGHGTSRSRIGRIPSLHNEQQCPRRPPAFE